MPPIYELPSMPHDFDWFWVLGRLDDGSTMFLVCRSHGTQADAGDLIGFVNSNYDFFCCSCWHERAEAGRSPIGLAMGRWDIPNQDFFIVEVCQGCNAKIKYMVVEMLD